MKKKFVYLFSLVVLLNSVTGCTLPLSTCPTGDLQPVTQSSPAQYSIVDTLIPTLEWSYPSAECNPEGYAITLWEGPVMVTNIGGGTGNPSTNWGPGLPLQPGRQYRWTVAPINGTTLGPASDTGVFFTGPVCSATSLIAPVQIQPADGSIVIVSNLLWWDYRSDCIPTDYQVDVSTDPAFTGPTLVGELPVVPLTRIYVEEGFFINCETHYWRIAAKVGTTVGPFSPTRSFVYEEDGTCGGGIPPASASIGGIVWHDLCAMPDGALPSPLPVGCVDDGAGSARANGIREVGEPGIPGVQVDLHLGGCATTSVASVLTDANGQYVFDGILAFGSYCVAVRSLNPPNDSILIPGEWTYPSGITGADAVANATVGTGIILTDKDFGWDYQLLPGALSADIGLPTLVDDSVFLKLFIFEKNAFCRKGPGINYSDVTAIPAGDTVNVLGISPDAQWIFINWEKFNETCWVAINTGKPLSDFTDLAVFTPPPAPQPPQFLLHKCRPNSNQFPLQ